jgi:hypothetical protein
MDCSVVDNDNRPIVGIARSARVLIEGANFGPRDVFVTIGSLPCTVLESTFTSLVCEVVVCSGEAKWASGCDHVRIDPEATCHCCAHDMWVWSCVCGQVR